MRKAIISTLAIAILLVPMTLMAAEAPDLKGTWVGTSVGIKHGTGDHKAHKSEAELGKVNSIEMTLTIETMEKGVFTGKHKSANSEEKILGVVCPDTGMVFMVDEDSYYTGKLLDNGKLQVVWMEVIPGKAQGIAMTLYTKK